ncbi:MAG: hypothetical protein ACTSQ8_26660 [Candidatus Helarchaeota archaeon]
MSSGDKCRWKERPEFQDYICGCNNKKIDAYEMFLGKYKECPYCGREIEVVKDES